MSRRNPTPLQYAALGMYAHGLDNPQLSWTAMGRMFGVDEESAGKCVYNMCVQFGLPRYRWKRKHHETAVEGCRNALRALLAEVDYEIPTPSDKPGDVQSTRAMNRVSEAPPEPEPAPSAQGEDESPDLSGLGIAELMSQCEAAASEVQMLQEMLVEAQKKANDMDREIRRRLNVLRAARRPQTR